MSAADEKSWRLVAATAVQCTTALEALFALAIVDNEGAPPLWDEEAGAAFVAERKRQSQIAAAVQIKKARELAAELAAVIESAGGN